MSKNIFDSGEVSRLLQRSLKKSKRKYDTYDILHTLKETVIEEYEGSNIYIDLCKTELNIISTKKKNNNMKEIRALIIDTLNSLVDKKDIDLLFEVNANKSNICIKCKRKIEH